MWQRIFDIIISFLVLFILLPGFPIIALLIRIESPGPALFKQMRVGQNGKLFKIKKFRTMNYEKLQEKKLTIGKNDPRITKVGLFLRKYKIDELPQLFNVLIGEMSLVGPRPELPEYVNFYNLEEKQVLKIKPGMTDWASINYLNENEILGRSANPERDYVDKIMKDKLRLNKYYIDNYNLQTYFKIILRTIRILILI